MPLQPYAIPPSAATRRYEDRWSDPADPFAEDRWRILRCSAFRRLDFKTQVFVPHEHDHYRTRLTHTLEVAQVGRHLGRALGLNEDLIEAVALAHDLGHPPFGHVGESALDELLAGHGGFEHNRQSLRIVDTLEHPFPSFRGLNLTDTTRECLARHETRYDTPAVEFALPGRAPLEGQAVALADEIAFTTADLEDALSAGWIDAESLHTLTLWRRVWQRAAQRYPQARVIHKRIQAVRGLLEVLCEEAISETRRRLAEWNIDSPSAGRDADDVCVALPDETAEAFEELQTFLLENVYRNEKLAEPSRTARDILRRLFDAFLRDPRRLPARYARRIEAGEDSPHRVVCDYLAGMTDRFCRLQHETLCGGNS